EVAVKGVVADLVAAAGVEVDARHPVGERVARDDGAVHVALEGDALSRHVGPWPDEDAVFDDDAVGGDLDRRLRGTVRERGVGQLELEVAEGHIFVVGADAGAHEHVRRVPVTLVRDARLNGGDERSVAAVVLAGVEVDGPAFFDELVRIVEAAQGVVQRAEPRLGGGLGRLIDVQHVGAAREPRLLDHVLAELENCVHGRVAFLVIVEPHEAQVGDADLDGDRSVFRGDVEADTRPVEVDAGAAFLYVGEKVVQAGELERFAQFVVVVANAVFIQPSHGAAGRYPIDEQRVDPFEGIVGALRDHGGREPVGVVFSGPDPVGERPELRALPLRDREAHLVRLATRVSVLVGVAWQEDRRRRARAGDVVVAVGADDDQYVDDGDGGAVQPGFKDEVGATVGVGVEAREDGSGGARADPARVDGDATEEVVEDVHGHGSAGERVSVLVERLDHDAYRLPAQDRQERVPERVGGDRVLLAVGVYDLNDVHRADVPAYGAGAGELHREGAALAAGDGDDLRTPVEVPLGLDRDAVRALSQVAHD